MKKFTAGANEDGVRLSRFVEGVTSGLPRSLLYKSFRNKRVKVNGRRAEPDARLAAGDVIELYINDEFFPEKPAPAAKPARRQPPVTVVYCRDGVDMPDVYDVYRSMRRYAWDNMVFLRSSLFIFDLSDRDPGSPESEDMKQEIKGLLRRYGSEGVEGIYPALEELIKEFLERPVKYKDAVKQIKYFFSLMCKEYIVDRDYIELEDGLEYILENCSTGDSMLREFRFLIGEEFSPSANGEKDKETLAGKIKGFLDANYKRNISSQILTEHFGFVSSYLSSIFKSYYRKTPMEYVTERRMEEGKRLLRQGNLRIKEVAEQLGYEDSLYFSKVFKRLEGISPKEYSGRGRAASEK